MGTQIDWQQELDRVIDDGPERPAHEYVASGRRAVRRRRATGAVAGLATAAVVAGVAWAAAPGGWAGGATADREASVADGPSPSAPSLPSSAEQGTERPGGTDGPTGRYQPPAQVVAGEVVLEPGSVVHERRDDVFPGKDTDSVALDLTHEGQRSWIVLEWKDGGSAGSFAFPGKEKGTFDQFVAESVAAGGILGPPGVDGEDPPPALATLTPDGLELRDGVTVLRRVDNPLRLEAPETSVGLVLEHDGTTTWMLATAAPDSGTGTSEEAARSGWPSFDMWLAEQVALQSGEPGLRLVAMDADGTLAAREPGVEVLEHVADPHVPEYVRGSTTASAAAKLTWRGDTWFVLVVRDGGEESVTTFAAAKTDGAETVAEFVEFARGRADDGGGLR